MTANITVENVSKMYTLEHKKRERYIALRDVLSASAKPLIKKIMHFNRSYEDGAIPRVQREEFWALQHVSFQINQGDRVGIIGRNGAGKSTLLKVLSRITEPTAGRIEINGRVASLLEVGTGFHPELTGRENIYLNGAILGMTRREITRKFDEIVAFADVERFLDTPVKRYSSGMYVRLAFSVAAHLEPEILIVDEVLAVGDAHFQKKCMNRMETVSKEGRTVLFVSHNMSAITALCSRALLIEAGRLSLDADTSSVVERYLSLDNDAGYESRSTVDRSEANISKVWFENEDGKQVTQVLSGGPICIVVETNNPQQIPLEIALSFYDTLRRPLWNFTHSMYDMPPLPAVTRMRTRIIFHPPKLTISDLVADVAVGPRGGVPYFDHIVSAVRLSVVESTQESYQIRYPNWPIFCEATLHVEAAV